MWLGINTVNSLLCAVVVRGQMLSFRITAVTILVSNPLTRAFQFYTLYLYVPEIFSHFFLNLIYYNL